MTVEEWRPIPGFPGYEVSDQGRVRSWVARRAALPHPRSAGSPDRGGYLRVTLYIDGRRHSRRIHCLVALAFLGPCPEGLETRHVDGNQLNNVRSNLAYGTPTQNRLDSVEHGTHHETAKTRCPQGHAYDDENTIWYRGSRYCRACKNARKKARRAALRVTVHAPSPSLST